MRPTPTTHQPPQQARHTGQATVIMPCLNERPNIQRAIEALLQDPAIQTIYVVDGGSTDGTIEHVTTLTTQHPTVHLLHNPHRIIAAAMNIGLHAANTTYVAKIDCHATVSPHYVSTGITRLKENPHATGIGGRRYGTATTPQGKSNALALSHPFGVGNSHNHYSETFRETDHASFGVYRREALTTIGGWDENLRVNEDVDLDHRLTQNGATILYEPTMHIYWHNQETANGLFHQYRRYGRGKAEMIKKNGLPSLKLRHGIPPAFVLGTAATLLASARYRALLLVLAPYVSAAGLAALHSALKAGDARLAPRVFVSFLAMHYGWGSGYLESFVWGVRPDNSSRTVGSRGGLVRGEGTIDLREVVVSDSVGVLESKVVSS